MNKHALLARSEAAAAPAAVDDAYRYWAFLSYSHADSAAAARLHRQLEIFHVPRPLVGAPHPLGTIPKRVIPIFRDRQELAASSDLGREISDALDQSRYLVVLCSPAAARSRWVDQEVREFKRRHGEDRVLAAIVEGEPFAADEAEECFPLSLRQRVDRKGKLTGRPAEPVAADLRDRGDGWHDGVLKLVAGMLHVGLDDLVQREQLRRQKRMTAIVGASLLGMAFTTGLSVVAINARDAARDERREAESMVGFMLGDLKDALEPIGRLDALDQVGARALQYYERQDKKALSDDQLTQRSKALTLLGQIAMARGQNEAAEARYREALRGTRELVERYPVDPRRLFDHAQNVFWVGELARQQGRIDQAEANYRAYARLAQRMVDAEPGNPTWEMEVQYARENIGIVDSAQREFAAASASFASGIAPLERLLAADPGNMVYRAELATMLAWLGDSRRDEGRFEEAIAARTKQVALLRQWLRAGPPNVRFQQQLVPAYQALGRIYADTGRLPLAIAQLDRAVAEARQLLAVETGNSLWLESAAASQLELARVLIVARRYADAEAQNTAGCATIDSMRARSRNAPVLSRLAMACLENRARLREAREDAAGALEAAERMLAVARAQRSGDDDADRFQRASAHLLIGDLQRRLGKAAAAREAWAQGVAALPPDRAARPRELAKRAELYARAGRRTEAARLVARLDAMGFRSM